MKARLPFAALLAMLACLPAACQRAPEGPAPHAGATGPHWGYEGAEGPDAWGGISREWTLCGEGRSQSPIDIDAPTRANLPALAAEFRPAALKIIHHEHTADAINTGHSIQVNYTEGDTLTVGSDRFDLMQYHFHSPSEHTIAGRRFPMEMHLVHKSAGGTLAVIGVLIEEGRHNAAFDPVWSNLPQAKGTEHHLEHVQVDVDDLLPASDTSYRYRGSLTTPPCSEGLQWIVMATPIELSAAQVSAFRAILHGNARPIQPRYGREVITDHLAGDK